MLFALRPLRRAALVLSFLSAVSSISFASVTASLSPTADAFAREQAPTSNFGGGGAVAVSGSASVNGSNQARGRVDSLLKFDAAAAKSAFDAAYGAGNWTIASATLRITEVGTPTSALFARGAGGFSIAWLSDDNWSEGSGTPAAPTTATGNQLSWNSLQTMLGGGSESLLGSFTSAGADGLISMGLALPAAFTGDAAGGNLLTLHAAPTTNTLGLTFNSRTNATPEARPILELTAIPEPAAALPLMLLLGLRRRTLGS